MNANEIVNVLRACGNGNSVCEKCPFYIREDSNECRFNAIYESADTIEAQQQEIEHLKQNLKIQETLTMREMAKVESLTADKDEQAGRIMQLEEALKKIANPILHMQKEAKSAGCVLDGVMAIRLSEDPHYYRKIAQKAIDALLGGAEG